MAMSSPSAAGADDPMMEINTTPLIDVMLVLLIMFIITLPPPTHSVPLDLPPNCEPNCPPPPTVKPDKNVIYIAPNAAVLWNQTPVRVSELKPLLEQTKAMVPAPELHMQPDPEAPYEQVDRVLSVVKFSEVTKLGFIGNEAYFNF